MTTQLAPVAKERLELITDKIDKAIASQIAISGDTGGARFETMDGVMEFAKLMAVSGQAVPKHCREAPGICLGVTIQAIEWRMSPFAVANKSYVVNDRLSWESQLIHAVIEQRAPIKGRLRCRYEGDGQKRKCTVWATPKDENEPLEYTSPEFAKIQPKNSPLWQTKPDLQLFYNTSRDWARMYFPDVILGVYSEDELAAITVDEPKQITSVSTLERIASDLDAKIAEEKSHADEKAIHESYTEPAEFAEPKTAEPSTEVPPPQTAEQTPPSEAEALSKLNELKNAKSAAATETEEERKDREKGQGEFGW